jgi:hypothetical protein
VKYCKWKIADNLAFNSFWLQGEKSDQSWAHASPPSTAQQKRRSNAPHINSRVAKQMCYSPFNSTSRHITPVIDNP